MDQADQDPHHDRIVPIGIKAGATFFPEGVFPGWTVRSIADGGQPQVPSWFPQKFSLICPPDALEVDNIRLYFDCIVFSVTEERWSLCRGLPTYCLGLCDDTLIAELEKAGSVSLRPRQVSLIDYALQLYCNEWFMQHRAQQQISEDKKRFRAMFKSSTALLDQLKKLGEAELECNVKVGKDNLVESLRRIASWSYLQCEILPDVEQRVTGRVRGKRGRPGHPGIAELVRRLAIIYRRAGGIPSSPSDSLSKFGQFLEPIRQRLPKEGRPASASAFVRYLRADKN